MTAPARATCDFYDREGVLAEERGASVGAHLAGCETCRARHAATAALRRAIAELPVPAGAAHWEQGVFGRIAARSQPRRRWAAGARWLVPLGAVALVLLVIVARRGREVAPDGPPALALSFADGPVRNRAVGHVAVGDRALVRARGIVLPNAEVRVYRDGGGLVVHCSTAPPCQRTGERLSAEFPVPALGRYRVVVVAAKHSLPNATGSFDDDSAALSAAGVGVHLDDSFEVW